MTAAAHWAALALLLLSACSDGDSQSPTDDQDQALARLPYARSVEYFEPGANAGFGAERLPDIVLGPPRGEGNTAGSLDVLSLGVGGEIVVGFGDRALVDGPGPDLLVFENPFYPEGDATQVYAEPGEVAVSEDGQTFFAFPCDVDDAFSGCAGKTPTELYDALEVDPIDPELTGGDAFDLEDLGLTQARFVRVRDRSTDDGAGIAAGFDLDAVGLVHTD